MVSYRAGALSVLDKVLLNAGGRARIRFSMGPGLLSTFLLLYSPLVMCIHYLFMIIYVCIVCNYSSLYSEQLLLL